MVRSFVRLCVLFVPICAFASSQLPPSLFPPRASLRPIAPARTARVSQNAYLLPLCRSADGPRRYRLLGRCLMPMCLQQSLAHYTCNQTVFSYIESIAACRRHSNNGLTSTNAINGMCLSLIILILDLIYMLSTDMPRFRKPARPVGLIHTITNHHKDFI